MKKVIATWGGEDIGKSSNILALAKEMIKAYPSHKVIYTSMPIASLAIDFRLILEINKNTIAFESMGDPNSDLNKRLPEIISLYNPDVLICACRSKGYTVTDVERAAASMSAEIIWSTPYQCAIDQIILNDLKAKHLLDLMVNLGLI
ncbi:hypothetical protein [Pedobacter sp. N23S346]|uniref:hypothetical protein n=1 Tax=Pedobacter sp. N23S346 TaxID=3402750 RepID=UPI003AD521D0